MTRVRRLWAAALLAMSCSYNSGSRWEPGEQSAPSATCSPGAMRCEATVVQRCDDGPLGTYWRDVEDCGAELQVCAPGLWRCTPCLPDAVYCEGQQVTHCSSDGEVKTPLRTCATELGHACRSGACMDLCSKAADQKSNVGCEYWAVDLDNAMVNATKNAAAQQFAVVVSNPQPDLPVTLQIERDDGAPGSLPAPVEVAQAVIAPLNLRVFKLGPREVDGSPEGEFNTGSHTALTRHGYRITSDFPVVAVQFNPLENVNVFSNDASLLKPREALSYDTMGTSLAYVVAGWPQTIAETDDPDTNFSASNPISLRVFLTIVGTQADTHVKVHPTAAIVAGGPVPYTPAGGLIEIDLDAFDVLNLETEDFGADFTGSTIEANEPVAVFIGSEASDAPHFPKLSERRCCADHLEEQLDPVRAAGKQFILVHSPSRTRTVARAGGLVGEAPEPEYVRFVAVRQEPTTVTTTLAPPEDQFVLHGIGDWHEVTAEGDFVAESDEPIHVVQVMASQDAANVTRGLPGGDPSLLVMPPREQFRSDYVFLTPDKYAFDFIAVAAPYGTQVRLDDELLTPSRCEVAPADGMTEQERDGAPPEFVAYRCQLSFATIDPDSGTLWPGAQNDGVHRIVADAPVGVVVSGFDAYVSYAYAAGTELKEIAPPR